MKEIPLIFTGPMVSALLADHKTQTRRLTGQLLRPGDRIWVKETWAYDLNVDNDPTLKPWIREQALKGNRRLNYRADEDKFGPMQTGCGGSAGKWRSPMLMPRWASRIVLEVTAPSRMERLQDITELGAEAEGLPWSTDFKMWCGAPGTGFYFGQARLAFKSWWIHLHGANFWFANPLVYVHTFKRVTP
jgi:hypothetical protein